MFVQDQVVPWGRSYQEYVPMFALEDAHADLRVLCCADGPANFNAEATRRGISVISADPLYRFDANEIRLRISATYPVILEETRRNVDHFVGDWIRSVDELGRVRLQAMEEKSRRAEPQSNPLHALALENLSLVCERYRQFLFRGTFAPVLILQKAWNVVVFVPQ
jgi:hypothetical protein